MCSVKKRKNLSFRNALLLQIAVFVHSLSGIFLKIASKQSFFSFRFFTAYCVAILGLGVYSILWQLTLKKAPLNSAFNHRAVTNIWAVLWGGLIFAEKITVPMIMGSAIIIIGVLVAGSSHE